MLGYFGIFTAICLLIANVMGTSQGQMFRPESVDVSVADLDGSPLSEAVTEMLSRNNQVTRTAEFDRGQMAEDLYSRMTQYVLVIPEHFQEDFSEGGGTLQVTSVPDSPAGYYLNSQIDAFFNQIRVYISAGFSLEDAAGRVLELSGQEPDVTLLNTGETEIKSYAVAFQYLPYIYLAVLIYSVSYVLKAFRKRDIRLRLISSPIPAGRQFLQGGAAFLLLFLVFWALTMMLPLLFGGLEFFTSAQFPWYTANTLLLLADSASLAFLIGTLIQDDNAINAMANIIGLGCSFLCGVFVPLELLSENVRQFSRFLPFYWYEIINEELGTHPGITPEMSSELFWGFLIQATFALAFFCLTLAVNRRTVRKS